MTKAANQVLVFAEDGQTQDLILSSVAAHALDAVVTADGETAAGLWSSAQVVVVADEQAERLVAQGLPQRESVFLVGPDPALLAAWSAPLAATVIALPEGIPWLSSALANHDGKDRAAVLAVIGGSGGAGASTLAAAISELAARPAAGAALVDLDPTGGGIDLLFGAERTPGWRWPKLLGAEGQVGDLRPYLPVVDDVSLVSMARGSGSGMTSEPVAAVISALRDWHSLVVIDPGRSTNLASREVIGLCAHRVFLVVATVRGVAAARDTLAGLGLVKPWLVVRRPPAGLSGPEVADALGHPVLAELPETPSLMAAAEVGEPPARAGGRRYRQAVAGLLAALNLAEV